MPSLTTQLNQFDYHITRAVQSGPSSLGPMMAAASMVGHPAVAALIALGLMGGAYVRRANELFAAGLLALVSLSFSPILKVIMHRVRPDSAVALGLHSYSFPSGHTYSSTIAYGLLAYLAARHLVAPWHIVVTILLALFIVLVGLSRVYLGAHYPTDVIGGWVLGAVILFVIIRLSGI